MPDAVAQPVTYPAIKVFKFACYTCHAEVMEPSSANLFEFMYTFGYAQWRCFTSDGFKASFQLVPTLFAYYQLVFSLCSLLVGGYKSVSQQLELNRLAYAAFVPIDGQL